MHEYLVWIYMINASLLLNHEIDSAYWKEWKLFLPFLYPAEDNNADRKGLTMFLILHFPLILLVLWGLLELSRGALAGLIISAFLSAAGIFAFSIHTFFIRKGHSEFTFPVSRILLVCTLIVSLVQGVLTVFLFF